MEKELIDQEKKDDCTRLMIAANKEDEAALAECRRLGPQYFIKMGDAFYEDGTMPNALQCYKRAFILGDRSVCVKLSDMFRRGQGTEKDAQMAANLLYTGASEGDAGTQYRYAHELTVEKWISQDIDKAVEWCQKAVEQGHADAMALLAQLYLEHDRGTNEEAVSLIKRSVELGSMAGKLELAKAYFNRVDGYVDGLSRTLIYRDWTKAAEILKELVDAGYEDAYTYWGLCLLDGRGVERDFRKSLEYLEKGAEQGSVKAQKVLGYIYAKDLPNFPLIDDDDWMNINMYDIYGDAELFNRDRDKLYGSSLDYWIADHKDLKAGNMMKAIKWYRMAAERHDVQSMKKIYVFCVYILKDIEDKVVKADPGVAEKLDAQAKKWFFAACDEYARMEEI